MSDVEYAAGDVDGDGVVNTTDYLRIMEHFLGTYDLLA
jgi:acyl-CoA thioesterase FadM